MQTLVHTETGKIISENTTLHGVHPKVAGQAWKFVGIAAAPHGDAETGLIRCSRRHPSVGRQVSHFEPSFFGCKVVVDVRFYQDRMELVNQVRRIAAGTGAMTAGGLVAWIIAEVCQHIFG